MAAEVRAAPRAFVLGDMDLVTPLGRAGVSCVPVVERYAAPRWSRYAERSIEVVSAWNEPHALVELLIEAARAESERPVLFYQSDPDLLMVSRYRDRLREAFDFVVADAELVEACADKAAFASLARELDLPVPASVVLEPGSPVGAAGIGAELGPGPYVVKPMLRRSDLWEPLAGAAKAIRVDDVAELAARWRTFDERGIGVVVQELLDGPESAIESYHVFVDDGGDVVAEFTGRKLRTRPVSYGHSTAVEVVDLPEVRRMCRSVVAATGLTGVAKLDVKRDASGVLRLLEINARFSLWHHPGALAGVNIPALVHASLTGARAPAVMPIDRPVTWCKPWHDVLAARDHGMSIASWLAFLVRCRATSSMSWRDPGAAAGAVRQFLGAR